MSGKDMGAEELVHCSEGFVEVYSSKHGLDKVCHGVGKGDLALGLHLPLLLSLCNLPRGRWFERRFVFSGSIQAWAP